MSDIKFKNVSVYYQDRKRNITTAVDDVSFVFLDKKINVLIGYSGCGKTTLLNCLSGKVYYEGDIYFGDKNIKDIAVQKRNIAYVSQEFVLYPNMTVYDNIAYPLKLLKLDRATCDIRIRETAEYLGIDFLLTRKPKYLSIGQQQRVAIARALVKRPDILLMDEPLSNLDKETSEEIRELIKDIVRDFNVTCIYVSHNIADCVYLADSIYVMNKGKISGIYTRNQFLNSFDPVVLDLKEGLPK